MTNTNIFQQWNIAPNFLPIEIAMKQFPSVTSEKTIMCHFIPMPWQEKAMLFVYCSLHVPCGNSMWNLAAFINDACTRGYKFAHEPTLENRLARAMFLCSPTQSAQPCSTLPPPLLCLPHICQWPILWKQCWRDSIGFPTVPLTSRSHKYAFQHVCNSLAHCRDCCACLTQGSDWAVRWIALPYDYRRNPVYEISC